MPAARRPPPLPRAPWPARRTRRWPPRSSTASARGDARGPRPRQPAASPGWPRRPATSSAAVDEVAGCWLDAAVGRVLPATDRAGRPAGRAAAGRRRSRARWPCQDTAGIERVRRRPGRRPRRPTRRSTRSPPPTRSCSGPGSLFTSVLAAAVVPRRPRGARAATPARRGLRVQPAGRSGPRPTATTSPPTSTALRRHGVEADVVLCPARRAAARRRRRIGGRAPTSPARTALAHDPARLAPRSVR